MQSSANHMESTQCAVTDVELYKSVTAEASTCDYKDLSCTVFPELLLS